MVLGDINHDGDVNILDIVFLESHLDVDISGNRPSEKYNDVNNELFNGGVTALVDYVIGNSNELEPHDLHIRQIDNVTEYKLSELNSTRLSAVKLTFINPILNIEQSTIPSNWEMAISDKVVVLYSSIRHSIRSTDWSVLFEQTQSNSIDVSGEIRFVNDSPGFINNAQKILKNGYHEPEPEPEPQPEPEPEIFNVFLDKNVLQTAVYEWATMDNPVVLAQYGPIDEWDVSAITDMSNLFHDASGAYANFNENISSWDVSNVTTIEYMFSQAESFNISLNSWNVSKISNMGNVFEYSGFNENISSWDVSEVTHMYGMFQYSPFNQPLNSWNVAKVSNLLRVFSGASSFNQDISDWDVSSATNMYRMFDGSSFNQDISEWDVSKNTSMGYMFSDSPFNQDISNWDVSQVSDMRHVFFNAYAFNQDISNWNIENVNDWTNFGGNATLMSDKFQDIVDVSGTHKWNYFKYKFGNDLVTNGKFLRVHDGSSPSGADWGVLNFSNIDSWDVNGGVNLVYNNDTGLSSWSNPTGLGSNIPYFIAMQVHGTYINQTIYIDSSGTYTLSFSCARRNPNHMTQYQEEVPISIEFNNTNITHTLSSTVFENFSTSYDINEPGDYSLKISNNIGEGGGTAGVFIANVRVFNGHIASDALLNAVDSWTSDSSGAAELIYGHTSNWDVSQVTDMEELFKDKSSFNENISDWDVSNVTNISSIFQNASSFNQDISGWDVSNVTNMSNMFYQATIFNQPIGNWNVSKVTRMTNMFRNTPFNQNISSWVVSSVTAMGSMFRNNLSFNQPLNNWDVSNVTSMNFMFLSASLFNQDISNWNIENVNSWTDFGDGAALMNDDFRFISATSKWNYFKYKFENKTALETAVTNWISDSSAVELIYGPISNWGVSNVTDMGDLFNGQTSFNADISNWDVSNVTNMTYMFRSALAFNQNISIWNVSSVTSMYGMFDVWSTGEYGDFNQPLGGVTFGTGDDLPANFGSMTIPVHSVTCSVDQWAYYEPNKIIIYNNTEGSHGRFALITMNGTYENSSSRYIGNTTTTYNTRDALIGAYTTAFAGSPNEHGFESGAGFHDITVTNGWDVSKVTNMNSMFTKTSFDQPLGNWNVSKVVDMNSMFAHTPFNQPIGNWDVSSVTDILHMFHTNPNFNQDIGNWDVSNVTNMAHMFWGSTSFNQDISNWPVSPDVVGAAGEEAYYHFASNDVPAFSEINPTKDFNSRDFIGIRYYFKANHYQFGQNLVTNGTFSQHKTITGSEPTDGPWGLITVTEIEDWDSGGGINAILYPEGLPYWNDPTLLSNHSIDKYFLGLQGTGSYISQTIQIDSSSTYTLSFLASARENYWLGENIPDDLQFKVELYNDSQTFEHSETYFSSASSHTFTKYSTQYNISTPGNYTFKISNDYLNQSNADVSGSDDQTIFIANVEFFDNSTDSIANSDIISAVNAWVNNDSGNLFTNYLFGMAGFDNIGQYSLDSNLYDIKAWGFDADDGNVIIYASSGTYARFVKITQTGNLVTGLGGHEANTGKYIAASNPTYTTLADLILGYNGATNSSEDNAFVKDALFNVTVNVPTLTYGPINTWKTNLVSKMSNLFKDQTTFNEDISNWDVSNVTAMNGMFRDADWFNQPLNNWDVSNVISLAYMFYANSSFNQPLNSWNTSKVVSLQEMFKSTQFDQDISNWDVSKVSDMRMVFQNATYFNQDISNWKLPTSGVSYDNYGLGSGHSDGLFQDSDKLYFNVNGYEFTDKANLQTAVDAWCVNSDSAYLTYGHISNWNVSQVTDMSNLFDNKTSFNDDISNWDVSNVTNMTYMFHNAESFDQPLDTFQVSKVTNMKDLFFNAKSFNKTLNWNVSSVTDMTSMFYGADVFTNNGDTSINDWDVSKVTRMTSMFREAIAFNQSIGNWNVYSVNQMDLMFYYTMNFNQPLDNWNVSNVTNMSSMFNNATAFNQDISRWNVLNVTSTNQFGLGATMMSTIFQTNFDAYFYSGYISIIRSESSDHPGLGRIEINSILAEDKDGSGIYPYNFTEITTNTNYPITNAFQVWDSTGVLQPTTCPAAGECWWGPDNFSNGLMGGWVKYKKMPYKLTINQRGGSGAYVARRARAPDYIKTRNEPPADPYDNSEWNIKYKFTSYTEDALADYPESYTIYPQSYFVMILGNSVIDLKSVVAYDINGNEISHLDYADVYVLSGGTGNADTIAYPMEGIFGDSFWTTGNASTSYGVEGGWISYPERPYRLVITQRDETHLWDRHPRWLYGSNTKPEGFNHNNWDKTILYEFNDANDPASHDIIIGDGYYFRDETELQIAIAQWFSDVSVATATYGNISTWVTTSIKNMSYLFNNRTTFNDDISNWDVSNVTNMEYMFYGTSFNQLIGGWDVSSVTNMKYLFEDNSAFNQNISGWDVSSVTDMNHMFNKATAFNRPLNSWDVSSVTDMNNMFRGSAGAFNQNISGWDVSKVTNMSFMFEANSSFNQSIDNWNVSKVETMEEMFRGTAFNQNISGWDVSSVTSIIKMFKSNTAFDQDISNWDLSIDTTYTGYGDNSSHSDDLFQNSNPLYFSVNGYEFTDESGLKTAVDAWISDSDNAYLTYGHISNWDVSQVTDMQEMFQNTYVGANGTFNEPIGNWNVSSVKNMFRMFSRAREFNQDISNWDVSSVTDMGNMFKDTPEFNRPIGNWNVSKVSDMSNMFQESLFNQPLNNWDVSNVTSMYNIFGAGASSDAMTSPSIVSQFNQDISNWDVSSVTEMYQMFRYNTAFNRPLNSWDVSSVTDMNYMFYGATTFNQPLESWDVSSVTDMNRMFSAMASTPKTTFNQPLESWDVSSVIDMNHMFFGCAFNQNISGWDVSKVTNMRGVFYANSSFNQPLNSWNMSKVTSIGTMFCSSPFNQQLDNWDLSELEIADHTFYNAQSFNQDISNWNMSGVTDIYAMFSTAYAFNQDISNWDVSNVEWSNNSKSGSFGIHAHAHYSDTFKASNNTYFTIMQ